MLNSPITNGREERLMRDVMLRVRFIHGLRVMVSPAMLKGIVFAASLVATLALVSIQHVMDNMSRLKVSAYVPYLASSYAHTSLSVEIAVILGFAAALWLARDIIKSWSTFRTSRLSYKAM